MKRIIRIAACYFLAFVPQAYADQGAPEKFRIAIGGYLISAYDSTVSVTNQNLGAGVSISPEDTLGLDSKQTVFRVDGHYRFNNNHALTYSWYRISSSGNKTLNKAFTWLDQNGNEITIPVNAQVNSELTYDIFKLGYLWSFYHSDKVELSAGAGLHMTRLSLDVQANTTPPSNLDARDVKLTVPLPVLSLGLVYSVTPKFYWYLKSEAFSLAFDEWEGTYTDSTLGVEYRAWNNVGLGVGLGNNTLKVSQTTADYKSTYDNRITGINVYISAYF